MSVEKYAAQAVKQEIDRILWEVWDPIGVNEHANARDEYSSYVSGVFELLQNGVSDDAIGQHLLAIVTDRMGLTGATIVDMRPTVAALREASHSHVNLEAIADSYLRYYVEKRKEDGWAFDRVFHMVHTEPKAALELTLLLLRRAGDDDATLAYVAAGPLEDLLKKHGLEVIGRLEQASKNDPRLQLALSGVWGIYPGHPVFMRWYGLMRKYGFADGTRRAL